MEYPTEWKDGKIRGSINNKGTTYLVRYNDPNGKTQSKYFSFEKNENKENAYDQALKWLTNENKIHNIAQNNIRYLNKDTIEVQIDSENTFTTDSKFVDLVKEYKIHLKIKKQKTTDNRKYVFCQSKKQAFTFVSKICNYKFVKYIDGNTLNLKLDNITESGAIKNENNVQVNNIKNINNKLLPNVLTFDPMLPLNKWILGKPTGTIFKRNNNDNILTVRVTDNNNKNHEKTINSYDYESEEDARKFGLNWIYESSCKLGMTKNLIRIIDDEYIEVRLTKNSIMITDIILLPLIQQLFLYSSKSNTNTTKKYYPFTQINNKCVPYYKLIMGGIMVDHLNNNPLDNRFINLIWTNYSENNRNKITNTEFSNIRLLKKEVYGKYMYEIRLKVRGFQFTKFFSFKKDNKQDAQIAKKNALIFKKNIYEISTTSDFLEFTGKETKEDLNFLLERLRYFHLKILDSAIFNPDEYLTHININPKDKYAIHRKYINIIFWRLSNLEHKMDIVEKHAIGDITNPITYKINNYELNYGEKYSIKKYEELTNQQYKSTDIIDNNTDIIQISNANIMDLQNIINLKCGILKTNKLNIKSYDLKLKLTCKNEHDFELTYDEIINDCKWCSECKLVSAGEKKMYEICTKLFNENFRKTRLNWLRSKQGTLLELDLYCDELKIALEYNGQQHYAFTPIFHSTKKEFNKLQEYDKTKERLCKKHNVTFIAIPYTIELDDIEQYILNKLEENNITLTKYKVEENDQLSTKKISQYDKTLKIIEQKKGIYISGEYITRDSKLIIQCEKNHNWSTTFSKILNGSWCHTCGLDISDDRKDKISDGMKKFNSTCEGKELKKRSHEKRSETMKKQKELIQKNIINKDCKRCKENKDILYFNKKSDSKDGFQSYCKTCINEIKQQRKIK